MTRYDVVDEIVVRATPAEVDAALDAEVHGRTDWWRPWVQITPLDGSRHLEVGSTMRFVVDNPRSRIRSLLPRFTGRVTAYEPGHRVLMEYVAGAFRGTGEWLVEPVDDAHTRLTFHWVTEPAGGMRLLSHVVDVPTMHSVVMRKGFKGLDRYLGRTQAVETING